LHTHKTTRIQSVAGPDQTDQIGKSVHAASMEGGEPNPEERRDLIGPAPKSFTPFAEKSSAPADTGAAAATDAKAKGAAKNAKEAVVAADKAKKEKPSLNKAKTGTAEDPVVVAAKAKTATKKAADKAEAVAASPLAAKGAAAEVAELAAAAAEKHPAVPVAPAPAAFS